MRLSLRFVSSAVLAAALLAGLPRAAWSERPIGEAVRAIEIVKASRESDKRQLIRNDPVFRNELVETGAESYAGLTFNDGTTLALGPNAEVLLDEFVYDDRQGTGQMVMTVTRGAVRFVSGAMSKNGYTIRTPTATLGIRGSIFVILVLANGQTWVFLQQGLGTVTNLAGQAVQLNVPGLASGVSPPPPGGAPPPPTSPDSPPQVIVVAVPGLINIQPPPGPPGSLPEGAIGTIASLIGAVTATNASSVLAQLAQQTGTALADAGGDPASSGATKLGLGPTAAGIGVGLGIGAAILLFVVDGGGGGAPTTTTTGP